MDTKKEVLVSGTDQGRVGFDVRKEWICKFCSETNVWTRWRCRRRFSNILAGVQEKHKKAIFAKNKGWYSGRSSLSGGEERKPSEQEEELKVACTSGAAQ